MLVRLGFVVVASVAVLTLQRANSAARHSRDYGQARKRKDKVHNSEHGEKEEEKEEVKTISGIINSARLLDDHDDDMLSEIESFLSGDIDIPMPSDRFDNGQTNEKKDKAHNSEHGEKEEEKEEVKTISGIINSARPLDDGDDDVLSEIESLLSIDRFDNGQTKKRKDKARNSEHGEKEEEKEEVKTISGIINSARPLDDGDDDVLSEIESLLSGDIDIPIPIDRFDNGQTKKRKDKARNSEHGEKEEEKEEVKTISGIINSTRLLDDDDDDVLSEIESLLSGDIDIPIPSDRFNVNGRSWYNTYMANEASEIERGVGSGGT